MHRYRPAPPCGASVLACPAVCGCARLLATRCPAPRLNCSVPALHVASSPVCLPQLAAVHAAASPACHTVAQSRLSQHVPCSASVPGSQGRLPPSFHAARACPLTVSYMARCGLRREGLLPLAVPGAPRGWRRRGRALAGSRAPAGSRHAPGCAVSCARFGDGWQEASAGRQRRVAAGGRTHAREFLSFADRRICLQWLRLGVVPTKLWCVCSSAGCRPSVQRGRVSTGQCVNAVVIKERLTRSGAFEVCV